MKGGAATATCSLPPDDYTCKNAGSCKIDRILCKQVNHSYFGGSGEAKTLDM